MENKYTIQLRVNHQLIYWREDIDRKNKNEVIRNWMRVYSDKGKLVYVDVKESPANDQITEQEQADFEAMVYEKQAS